jgi:hypothetical protein
MEYCACNLFINSVYTCREAPILISSKSLEECLLLTDKVFVLQLELPHFIDEADNREQACTGEIALYQI